MKFIKLTFIDNRTTFVNTETISRMTRSVSNDSERPVDAGFDLPLLKGDRDFTHILAGGDWFKVKETPEEIMTMINDGEYTSRTQTFEFGELTIDADGFPTLNISYVDENGNTQHEGMILYKRMSFAVGPENSRSYCMSEVINIRGVVGNASNDDKMNLLSAFASSAIAKWCAVKKLVPREEIDLFYRSKEWLAFIHACMEWMWPNKE